MNDHSHRSRVLVLGATGHLGQAVTRHFLAGGRAVTAITRRADPPALRGLHVNVVRIDDELRSLPDIAAGHDVLIDAGAPYPLELGIPGSPRWRDHVDTAVSRCRIVLDAAARHRLRLAFISSCATLPRHESGAAASAALWRRSISPYFEAKMAMERMVLSAARAGLPAAVVNPAACFGPWEFQPDKGSLVRLVLERKLPAVLDQTMCVIDVRDVAGAIERALSREFFGRQIPLAGHNVYLPELALKISLTAGDPPLRPAAVDGRIVAAAAYWTQMGLSMWSLPAPEILSFLPLIPDVLPMQPSPEQIALGVTIRPLEETLRDAVVFHRTLKTSAKY